MNRIHCSNCRDGGPGTAARKAEASKARLQPERRTVQLVPDLHCIRKSTLPGTYALASGASAAFVASVESEGHPSSGIRGRDGHPSTYPAMTKRTSIHPSSSLCPVIHALPAWRIPAFLPRSAMYSRVLKASEASPDTVGPEDMIPPAFEDTAASFADNDGSAYGHDRTLDSTYQTPACNRTASASSSAWPPPSRVDIVPASAAPAFPFPA